VAVKFQRLSILLKINTFQNEEVKMQVKMGERIVKAWQVKHDEAPLEEWVQHLFDQKICFWNPRDNEQLRFSLMFGGAARVGDYLIYLGKSDIKVISEKRFNKEFTIL